MTADPHPAALTPEQIADRIVATNGMNSGHARQAFRDAIANAIRSAVMAERERCAMIVEEFDIGEEFIGASRSVARRDELIAAAMRAHTTEADHAL